MSGRHGMEDSGGILVGRVADFKEVSVTVWPNAHDEVVNIKRSYCMPICMDHVIISDSVLPSACKNCWYQHSTKTKSERA